MQQGGAGAVVLKGQSKGWREIVLTISWPGQPVCPTPSPSHISAWQLNLLSCCWQNIFDKLIVRCGILSTSYFRSRTGWVYHQIRIATIFSSWIPVSTAFPLSALLPWRNKDSHFCHSMIILATVSVTMFQDPMVVIKKNLNKIRSQKWMAFIITSIWHLQHLRFRLTFSSAKKSLLPRGGAPESAL